MTQSRADGDRLSYREAVDQLAAAQKSGAGVPAYLRWVNRGLGRRAAAGAFVVGWTPNAVTAASAALSVAAMVMIVIQPPSIAVALAAAALLLAGYALDSADGQLARLTGTGSLAGEWLDHVVDAARLPLFHLAIALHIMLWWDLPWLAAVAFAFCILSSTWFFAQTLAEKLSPDGPHDADAPAWVSFAKLPYDVGLLYLAVAFLASDTIFAVLYSAIFAVTVFVAMFSLRRKYRSLASQSSRVASDQTGG
jgi:phosphatidylglycerophosphate synthase